MKKIISLLMLLTSINAFAETIYFSDGTWARHDQWGNTYYSNGSTSRTDAWGNTYYSDGTTSRTSKW